MIAPVATVIRQLRWAAPLAALGIAVGSGLVPPAALGLNPRGLALIPEGILLGVAEAGAVIFLSGLAFDAVAAVRLAVVRVSDRTARRDERAAAHPTALSGPRSRRSAGVDASMEVRPPVSAPAAGPIGQANWLAFTRGRWAAYHRDLRRRSPIAVVLVLLLTVGFAEEGLLRGAIVVLLRPAGGVIAVPVVVAASVVGVCASPAARRDPCSAVVCAGLVGFVHGVLMWLVPTVVPLVAARTALYLFAIP